MTEQELYEVLLHKTKTKSLIKRLKKQNPKSWQRVYGNVRAAYEELREERVHKTLYKLFLFPQLSSDSWSLNRHYDQCMYLSPNFRLCKLEKAANFSTKEEALSHFEQWSKNKNYRVEVIETKSLVSIEQQ